MSKNVKIGIVAVVILFLVVFLGWCAKEAQAEGPVKCNNKCSVKGMSPADRVSISKYDVAVVWRVDSPEAYYIIDTKFNLCMFVVSTVNGISTTRVPCKPFVEMVEPLEDKYDKCHAD